MKGEKRDCFMVVNYGMPEDVTVLVCTGEVKRITVSWFLIMDNVAFSGSRV